MNERIEAYLAVLNKHLEGRVRDDLRSQRVAELRSHLHLAIHDHMAGGMDEDASIRKSLQNLGSAKVVAEDLVRQHRGFDRKSPWILLTMPLGLLVVFQVLTFQGPLFRENNGLYWTAMIKWSWIPLFVVFALQVWRSRRWLVTPMVLFSLGLAVIPSAIFWSLGYVHGPSKKDASQVAATLEYARGTYKSIRAGGHAAEKGAAYLVPESNETVVTAWVPGTVVGASVTGHGAYFISPVQGLTQREADARWIAKGSKAIANLQSQLDKSQDFSSAPWSQVESLGMSLLTITFNTCFLIATNWIVLALAKWRRSSANSDDPMLA